MARGGLFRNIAGVAGAIPGIIGGGAKAVGQGIGRLGGRAWDLAESAKVPALNRAFVGDPEETRQTPIFNEEQEDALSQILQQALGQYQNIQTDFGPIEEHARRQFQEQTIPSLAERFTAMGAQESSIFPQQLGQAGADLESQLAALRSQFGLEQGRQAQGFLSLGLQPQFETNFFPRSPGFLEIGAKAGAKAGGEALPRLLAMLSKGGA